MLHTRNLPLLHSKCKFAPRWLGPFRMSARRGTNASLLDGLPPWMASVHPVFNVSQLKPCLMSPPHLTYQAEYQHPLDQMIQALKMMLQKSLKLTSSEPKEDMAPEDNTS